MDEVFSARPGRKAPDGGAKRWMRCFAILEAAGEGGALNVSAAANSDLSSDGRYRFPGLAFLIPPMIRPAASICMIQCRDRGILMSPATSLPPQ